MKFLLILVFVFSATNIKADYFDCPAPLEITLERAVGVVGTIVETLKAIPGNDELQNAHSHPVKQNLSREELLKACHVTGCIKNPIAWANFFTFHANERDHIPEVYLDERAAIQMEGTGQAAVHHKTVIAEFTGTFQNMIQSINFSEGARRFNMDSQKHRLNFSFLLSIASYCEAPSEENFRLINLCLMAQGASAKDHFAPRAFIKAYCNTKIAVLNKRIPDIDPELELINLKTAEFLDKAFPEDEKYSDLIALNALIDASVAHATELAREADKDPRKNEVLKEYERMSYVLSTYRENIIEFEGFSLFNWLRLTWTIGQNIYNNYQFECTLVVVALSVAAHIAVASIATQHNG